MTEINYKEPWYQPLNTVMGGNENNICEFFKIVKRCWCNYMMRNMNLDIESYNLDDILNLFKLPVTFDETGLKNAKKVVLKTHPDKSGLDKKYFLFFTEAYKILYSLYKFKTNKNNCVSTKYSLSDQKDKERDKLVEDLLKDKNFNNKFNELFEKHKLNQERVDNGYGDWLKSEQDIDNRQTTKANMNQTFIKKDGIKSNCRGKRNRNVNGGDLGFSDVVIDAEPQHFGSSLFSSLQYEDLRKAHTETVVPVTEQDDGIKEKYNTVNELQQARSRQNIKPLSLNEAKKYMGEGQFEKSRRFTASI